MQGMPEHPKLCDSALDLKVTGLMTTVVFTCWRCGAVYRAAQHRRTDRYYGVFNCIACHTQVYAWNGAYDFLDWQVGFSAPSCSATPAPCERSHGQNLLDMRHHTHARPKEKT
jgi:predicted RNA-binding Zn-ribbon protein involved in translation (DUF1610 family)